MLFMIRKVLIVTSEPFPNGMAGTNRIISLAKGFISIGLKAQILCISQFESNSNYINNPVNGCFEDLKFSNIFKTVLKSRFKAIRLFKELLKPILVFYFCFKNMDKNTLTIFYSAETLPAIAIRLAAYFKKSLFVKDETEHPFVRKKSKNSFEAFFFSRLHYNQFDGLFVITANLYEYFKVNAGYKKPLLLVPMIVDVERFNHKTDADNLITNNKSIVFSGVLDDKKEGISILLNAFALVARKYDDYILNLYGEVDETQKTVYQKMISQLQIESKVSIHGYRSREAMTQILKEAGILVFTRQPELTGRLRFFHKTR